MRGASRFLASDLRNLFDFGALGGLTDGELLDRTVIRGSSEARLAEAAFEALVMRHGPMVLRVCRLHLRESSDVDDAFQATFLVFARRLGSIRRRESVASWLHGVASRVAARARVEAARRNRIEGGSARTDDAASPNSESADTAFDRREIESLIQEEVRRLPGRYREVVILCFWEGLTQEQAARRLGCPVGTVRSRSARARDLLRTRLTRRGLAPASAIAASMLGRETAFGLAVSSHVSPALVRSAVRACAVVSSGLSLRAAATGSVLFLTEGFLRSVLMIKIKTVVLASAVIGLGFLAAGRGEQNKEVAEKKPQRSSGRGQPRGSRAEPPRNHDADKPKKGVGVASDYIVEAPDTITVEVLDALPGRPITGGRLVRPDGKISLGFYGELYVEGLTLVEIKEKVIELLQRHINDETLGLQIEGENGKIIRVDPKDCDRVYVDVAKSNSKFYYLQGEVAVPGRLPIKGNETVLDAINLAGGLNARADRKHATLYRKPPKGKTPEKLAVDIEQVLTGGDPATNYPLRPGDRLVVRRDPTLAPEVKEVREEQNARNTLHELDRRVRDMDGRLKDLDRKLDRIIEKLGGQ